MSTSKKLEEKKVPLLDGPDFSPRQSWRGTKEYRMLSSYKCYIYSVTNLEPCMTWWKLLSECNIQSRARQAAQRNAN